MQRVIVETFLYHPIAAGRDGLPIASLRVRERSAAQRIPQALIRYSLFKITAKPVQWVAWS